MSLVLNQDQRLLRDTAADFLKTHSPVSEFRALRDAGSAYNDQTWQKMVEFGWPAILVPEDLDGLEFGLTGLGLIVVELGKQLALSPLSSSAGVAVSALLQCEVSERRDALIKAIAADSSLVSFAHQESDRHDNVVLACTAVKSNDGWLLTGNKKAVALADHADHLLVTAKIDSDQSASAQTRLFVVDTAAEHLERQSVSLIDSHNYADISLNGVAVTTDNCMRWNGEGEDGVAHSCDVGALLAACELYGCSLASFDRTLTYLSEREQFGQKIGSFQSLQHRMAHAYSAMELLKSVIFDALDALESGRKDAAIAVSHAKALANDTAKLVTSEAIQMHGGIGITDELDIGLYYKRARVLRSLWGDSVYHRRRFAELNGF